MIKLILQWQLQTQKDEINIKKYSSHLLLLLLLLIIIYYAGKVAKEVTIFKFIRIKKKKCDRHNLAIFLQGIQRKLPAKLQFSVINTTAVFKQFSWQWVVQDVQIKLGIKTCRQREAEFNSRGD